METEVRFYRINRAAYTISELVWVTDGPRRLLLPFLIIRQCYRRAFRLTVPAKDLIADRRTPLRLDEQEAAALKNAHPELKEAERQLRELQFSSIEVIHWWDARHPFKSYILCGIDAQQTTFGGCTLLTNGTVSHSWFDVSSNLTDGRILTHFNSVTGGALRPHPSFIMFRCPGATMESLVRAHRSEMERLIASGCRFLERRTLDEALQAGAEAYSAQISHWIETGLLIPDTSDS
jgi:hypothetical protein